MKLHLFLFLFCTSICSSQLKQSEFDEALQLISSNNQNKALVLIETHEKKFPNDSRVLFLRGMYSFRDGDLNSALMKFSNAINADPNFALAYAGRGQLLAYKGLFDKAIADVSMAMKIEPKNLDYIRLRCTTYNQNNQFDKALEDSKTLIILDSENIMNYYDAAVFSKLVDKNYNADPFFSQAYANKAIKKYVTDALFAKFLLGQARFEEAKFKYEAALLVAEREFDDDDLNNVAMVYYKTKDYDKAILYFNKAISINSKNVTYYNNLASVFIDLKNWEKVKETAQSALNVDSNDAMANMYMAVGLKFTGNESLALEYEAKAKRLEAEQNN